jgi:hypothetical protein
MYLPQEQLLPSLSLSLGWGQVCLSHRVAVGMERVWMASVAGSTCPISIPTPTSLVLVPPVWEPGEKGPLGWGTYGWR